MGSGEVVATGGKSAHRAGWTSSGFAGLGAAVGVVAWWGPVWCIPLTLVLAPGLARTRSRMEAFALMTGHAASASWGLPIGAARFFGIDVAPALLLWGLAASVQGGVFALAWSAQPARHAAGAGVALLALALPPLGTVGWASPLASAGWLFAGWGTAGLVLMGFVFVISVALRDRAAGLLAVLIAELWVYRFAVPAPKPLEDWAGVDLALHFATEGQETEASDGLGRLLAVQALAQREDLAPGDTLLLPESAFGPERHPDRLYWQALSDGAGINLVGGGAWTRDGERYNALWLIQPEMPAQPLYAQRQPVPVSMWRPGASGGWAASWFGPAIVDIDGQRLGVLICYEQLLVWPAVASGTTGADGFLLPSNLWWAGGTRIAAQLDGTSTAWARLYGVPVVRAVNHGSSPS